MSEPLVQRTDTGGVATLTLNRPDKLNALSPSLFVELREHIDALAHQPDEVACVVLRGAGRSFCAGNDLGAIAAGEEAPTPHFQGETVEALEALPQPSIAAVRGHCYTGGLELALGCDLMVVSETAKLADTHGKWGLTPVWGLSQRLPRRVGMLRAKEMMFTGRVVGGAEAAEIGLALECVPDDALEARIDALTSAMAENSWHTLRGDKMLLHGGVGMDLSEGLAWERQHSPGRGPDSAERIAAFGKKG
ncbi:MAG: enoyl-CoA hydratase/isomerase family protein [Acidobacteriota bacterium]